MQQNKFFKQNQFIKMHGAGNSFVMIEYKGQNQQQLKNLAIKLCDRNKGIGSDTLLVILSNKQHQISQQNIPKYYMKAYNKDGTFAEMCGNGLRCFAVCLKQLSLQQQNEFLVKTDSGIKKCIVSKQNSKYHVKIQMGLLNQCPQLQDCSQIVSKILQQHKFTLAQLIQFGVPHLVIYLPQMPTPQQIVNYSKQLQKLINANINYAQIIQIQQQCTCIYLQTFQRGCGLTLACGTGASGTYAVGIRNKLFQGPAKITVQGGLLQLYHSNGIVIKDGPAQFICRGIYF